MVSSVGERIAKWLFSHADYLTVSLESFIENGQFPVLFPPSRHRGEATPCLFNCHILTTDTCETTRNPTVQAERATGFESAQMAPPKVTAKNCKICNKVLASSVVVCIHCGAADPIKKKDPPIWPWAVFFSVVAVLLLL